MPTIADLLFHVAIFFMFLGIHTRQHLFLISRLHKVSYDYKAFHVKQTNYFDVKKIVFLISLLISYLVYVITQIFIGFYITLFLLIYMLWLFLFDHKKDAIIWSKCIKKMSLIKLTIYILIQVIMIVIDPYSLFYVGFIYIILHPFSMKYEAILYRSIFQKDIQTYENLIDFSKHRIFVLRRDYAEVTRHLILQLSKQKISTFYGANDNYDDFLKGVYSMHDALSMFSVKDLSYLKHFKSYDLICCDANIDLNALNHDAIKHLTIIDPADKKTDEEAYHYQVNHQSLISSTMLFMYKQKNIKAYVINTWSLVYINLLFMSATYVAMRHELNMNKDISMLRGYGHSYEKEPYLIYDASKIEISDHIIEELSYVQSMKLSITLVTSHAFFKLDSKLKDHILKSIKNLCIIQDAHDKNLSNKNDGLIHYFKSYDDVMTYLFHSDEAVSDLIYMIHI